MIRPNNNWSESAVYIVENTETFTYSIGYTRNNTEFEYPDILKNLTLGKMICVFKRYV